MTKIKKDYYKEISDALLSYEEWKTYYDKDINWICDRIDWAWKWKKITPAQLAELTDRVCTVLERID